MPKKEKDEFDFGKIEEQARELEGGLFPTLLELANNGQEICVAIDPDKDPEHKKYIERVSGAMNFEIGRKAIIEGWSIIKIEKVILKPRPQTRPQSTFG